MGKKGNNMDLTNFENYLKLNIDSSNSRKIYLSRVKLFFKSYSDFNQTNVDGFLASCIDKNLKANTFNGYKIALLHYSRFLKQTIEFPKQKKPIKSKKAFLTLVELENELIPYFNDIFSRDVEKRKLIVRLMFCSGLRPCEVVNLKKEDLDFTNNWIIVKDTKNKTDRITMLVPNLHTELKEMCANSKTEYVFNISKTFIKYTFVQLNEMLSYKKHLNPYQLRHGFCHYCLQQGIDLKRVKEMMGHWDIKMTEEYLALEPKEIIDVAVKKFKYHKGFQKI
jgi:site-specific recombinase XerD